MDFPSVCKTDVFGQVSSILTSYTMGLGIAWGDCLFCTQNIRSVQIRQGPHAGVALNGLEQSPCKRKVVSSNLTSGTKCSCSPLGFYPRFKVTGLKMQVQILSGAQSPQ